MKEILSHREGRRIRLFDEYILMTDKRRETSRDGNMVNSPGLLQVRHGRC